MTLPVAAAILAGGQSSRMGTDKAHLLLGGVPLLERTARTVLDATVFAPLLVVGRESEKNWPFPNTVFLPDEKPGLGPLGGLQTALHYVEAHIGKNVPTLALGCDMPYLTVDALHWISDAIQNVHGSLPDGLAIIGNAEQIEPLFSLYTPSCLFRIAENMARGRRSLWKLIQTGDFAYCTAPPEIAAQLTSVNTPEAWAEAQGALRREQAQNGVHVKGAQVGVGE